MDKKKFKFYECIRRLLYLSRLIGFLPVCGLLSEDSKKSRGTIKSVYTIIYVYNWVSLIANTGLHVFSIFQEESFGHNIEGLIFKPNVILIAILLIQLARNWEKLLTDVEEIERLLPPHRNVKRKYWIINGVVILFLLMCLVEHITYLVSGVNILRNFGGFPELTLKEYFTQTFLWAFKNIPFTYAAAFMCQILKLQATFLCHFVDILIVSIALYLINQFNHFQQLLLLKQKRCHFKKNTSWIDLQAHFTRLDRLVKIFDDYFSSFILLSFLWNLILICRIIFRLLKNGTNMFSYLIMATVILLTKATLVSATTSYIHTLSRKPLNILHTIPSHAYTLELQRFMDQVYYSEINLTGLQYFRVTRGTILSMISTIITYELVLLQFQHPI